MHKEILSENGETEGAQLNYEICDCKGKECDSCHVTLRECVEDHVNICSDTMVRCALCKTPVKVFRPQGGGLIMIRERR